MSLPVNIKDLIRGHSVEWERLEFKRGWNPEDVIHTICAFANDMNNWGGGYVVIDIEANDGMPVLPPAGLPQNQLDKIQNEVLNIGNRIQPTYLPIIQPYVFDGQHILVLWCPAGDFRPYSAPTTLGEKAQRQFYVQTGSNTVIAKNGNLRRMYELATRVPFDDRINQEATIDDFDLTLIQAYLHEVKSDLYEESKRISIADLVRNMHIAKGSDEYLRPVNVGLLFFSRTPEKFFDRSWIELVRHKDDVGDNFTEHYFKGALHHQLRDALSFIKTNIIHEHVIKVPNQAEALRFYNYPYEAVEEALSNAVYHKGYDLGNPIEVQIFMDNITVLSYPGPVPPVDQQMLKHKKIVARNYRNRRIGDFLKELDLTEGRGTGFPKMYKKMEDNGSPQPIIETDEENNYFMITLPINPMYFSAMNDKTDNQVNNMSVILLEDIIAFSNGVSNGVSNAVKEIICKEIHDKVKDILEILLNPTSRNDLFKNIALSNQSKNRAKYLDILINIGWIAKEFPNEVNNPTQRYFTTESGKRILALMSMLDEGVRNNIQFIGE
jgi:ATP-dependent DNA helicase RecG